MREYTGWLFDLYAHPRQGVVLWLAEEDGRRHFFRQDFQTTFYVSGPPSRLRLLWRYLRGKPVNLARTERLDLYTGPVDVLEVQVVSPSLHAALFEQVHDSFSDLSYYDADLPLSLRYAGAYGVSPLARCKLLAQNDGRVLEIAPLDTPWELDPPLPSLRELHLTPDCDPSHAAPQTLLIEYARFKYRVPLDEPRQLLGLLNTILRTYDPDVLLTEYGDTWLFSYLEQISQANHIPFNPNRDLTRSILRRKEVSFFNYGRAHYRGEQVHLFGRWHIDQKNCMTYGEYGLAGAIEQARMTGLPVQEIARRSPGAGIAAMQTITALHRGVLSPYQSQRGEISKAYAQLFNADRGGLVFEPLLGVYPNVAVLDFISMYPSAMIEYNLSPETVGASGPYVQEIPGLNVGLDRCLGLVPETLRPMRDKRLRLKRLLKQMDPADPRRPRYQAMSKALKWLSVVAYGRLGYANSTFGRINAHEAVTHVGRLMLLRAKAIAEQLGYTVLHLYVDSLFLCRPGASRPEDFQSVIDAIEHETHLFLDLDGLYPWMAFLGRREQSGTPVANRFFGFQANGEPKIRGIALRREDTPLFVARAQMRLLDLLAQVTDPSLLLSLLPEALTLLRSELAALEKGAVPLEELLITQTLSRALDEFKVASPLARAALQLQQAGKPVHMGQRVRYLHTRTHAGVFAWGLPGLPASTAVETAHYEELLLRAAYEVLQPLGITESFLRDRLFARSAYLLPDTLFPPDRLASPEIPFFAPFSHPQPEPFTGPDLLSVSLP